MKLILYILFVFYAAASCLLLRQLPFNKINFHKATRPSLGFYHTESTYYSLVCFVLFSALYTLFESSHCYVLLEVLIPSK